MRSVAFLATLLKYHLIKTNTVCSELFFTRKIICPLYATNGDTIDQHILSKHIFIHLTYIKTGATAY